MMSLPSVESVHHYANTPMLYTAIFQSCKNDYFQMNKVDNYPIFAQNIDCGYTLEPTIYVLEQKLENNVYPCKPHFHYIKVGLGGINHTDKFFLMLRT